jgi:hypothetical protein
MSRSLSYLRWGLLGIAVVASLGFGATQAFATPDHGRQGFCPMVGEPTPFPECEAGCPEGYVHCSGFGECVCVPMA